MANVKTNISTTLGQAIIDDLFSQKSTYYYTLGKSTAWTNEEDPELPIDTEKYELQTRSDFLYMKRIDRTSISFVLPRVDYVSGIVYDIYDDSISLDNKNYYVMNSDYNVYKCLFNNTGAPSTIEPFGTSAKEVTLDDGYVWKYIYSVPPSLRNKFLTSDSMPIYNSITEKYYSRGSINTVSVDNSGQGYGSFDTELLVSGDGYLENNPYAIKDWQIIKAGSGYTTIPSVQVADQFKTSVAFTPNSSVVAGRYIKVSDSHGVRFYLAETPGVLGSSLPTHYYSSVQNGDVTLKHVGTKPKATCQINTTTVGSVKIIETGFGYNTTPSVTKNTPGSGATFQAVLNSGGVSKVDVITSGLNYTDNSITIQSPYPSALTFAQSTSYLVGQIVKYEFDQDNIYFYRVDTQGSTSTSNPTHTSGSSLVGTCIFTVVAKQAVGIAVLGTVSDIDLFSDVERVRVSNRGTGYDNTTTVSFVGGNPEIPAVGNAVVVNGKIEKIVITDPGYGYESAPSVQVTGTGSGFSGSAIMQYGYGYKSEPLIVFSEPDNIDGEIAIGSGITEKTNAIIEPIIENGNIRGISVIDGGIAYTTATITVLGSGSGAKLTPLLASGDLFTLQAQSELLATPGSISSIVITNQGDNITILNATVIGDGTGATLQPEIVNGKLKALKVINSGMNYSFANILITANNGAILPTTRVILSPVKGHGSNPIREFNAKSISFYGLFEAENNNGIIPDNYYRQISVLKNPLKFDDTFILNKRLASPCYNIKYQNISFALEQGMVLEDADGFGFRIIDFTNTNILLQALSNNPLTLDSALSIELNNITYVVDIVQVTEPQVDKYSGEILFIENLKKFRPTSDQKISINTIIKLT